MDSLLLSLVRVGVLRCQGSRRVSHIHTKGLCHYILALHTVLLHSLFSYSRLACVITFVCPMLFCISYACVQKMSGVLFEQVVKPCSPVFV